MKDVKAVYPIARACFNTICVPVIHTNYAVFKQNMDTALKYGSNMVFRSVGCVGDILVNIEKSYACVMLL